MRLIAIETATLIGSIAIADDEKVVSEFTINVRATHSEKLMATMDHLLSDSGLTINDMDGIAISIGPGSFTGLRIGLSAAKGLSYASRKPLIGIPTLDALASSLPFSRYLVCPILDAKKGEVYTAIYKKNEKVMDDIAVKPASLVETIKENTVFLGDGVGAYRNLLKEQLRDFYHEAPLPLQLPKASNVAMLALERLRNNDMDDPFVLVPRYIRKSEAELKWKG